MKVVLFCGGLGMRLREFPDAVPKPMVPIGGQPILWHLMKYYAHQGFRDFVLCLGYRGNIIREYFERSTEPWSIAYADTGIAASVGERLRAVEQFVAGEPVFLANYADGLSDLPIIPQLDQFQRMGVVGSFLSVRPNLSYHTVVSRPDGLVTELKDIGRADLRVNGGFFIFKREIFRYLREGEDLVEEPFRQLIRERQLVAHRYDGFWVAVDTMKDKHRVDGLYASGNRPWMIWASSNGKPD